MKTDPFTDAFQFLTGATGDHEALGWGRYPVALLFVALLVASVALARTNWRADPAQRTAAHLWTWLFRVLLGCMWFQGSLWKLPLPDAEGCVTGPGRWPSTRPFRSTRRWSAP